MGGGAEDLELLRERLDLAATGAQRAGRGVALVSVRLHPRDPAGRLHRDCVGELHEEALGRLRTCLRRIDTVATGEPLHFVILLERPETGAFAVHAADQIVGEMRQPFQVGVERFELVASVGISVCPDDGETAEDLIRCADAACHAAQMGGGDLFGFYSGSLNEAAGRRVALERSLVEALDRREFQVHYQPQIDTRDGTLVGVESLLRWSTGKLGQVSPAEFIPVLEATGRIDEVGAWALEEACRQAAEWCAAGQPLRMGVNVSAQQLRDERFEETVLQALQRTELDPTLLELELTESVLVENPSSTRKLLESFRRRGIRVAVDDFGTGYASLSYVRRFPMDKLKIDREFVRGLPVDPENVAITSAIVALARTLRLDIVAEGVETEAEEEFLHSLQCHVVQGFRHARPMSAADFAEWRRRRPWA